MVHEIFLHIRLGDEYATSDLKIIGTWGEAWRIACSQARAINSLQLQVTHMTVDMKGFKIDWTTTDQ